jgi:hypothetical protein
MKVEGRSTVAAGEAVPGSEGKVHTTVGGRTHCLCVEEADTHGRDCAVAVHMLLIIRCAWHRRYSGWPKVIRLERARRLRPGWSDGMCPQCLAEFRRRHLGMRNLLALDAVATARRILK